MLKFLKIEPRDRSGNEKFNSENALYEVLKSYCFDNARIIEAGPDVGPWTPILLEHIAFTKEICLMWAGIEKAARSWRDVNEYSDSVLFSQDVCKFSGAGSVNADLALSIRPRVYGVGENELASLINQQHLQLLTMLKTGGYLIIMIHKNEYYLVEPFWGKDCPIASVVITRDASPNRILVLRKK